ncbi:tRNA (guanine(46)-N(7))-methyltransferase TrmB [Elioraea rosea]|uniref:tRNA (guanine(46)-N(7))-methyltransferase TrmB n=1 Tax=Elioraea rosea TaxID=2492390 RepID=UPI001183A80A|nr:tRNA (guanine(46)-N(7))-methyltransferase TrmB [Elioraea rosea]
MSGEAAPPARSKKIDRKPAERLYGRRRGHALRPRQERLLSEALPRMAFPLERASEAAAAFAVPVRSVWLEVGFGGGEHAEAIAAANPDIGLIAAEVFENGVGSLLSRLVPEGEEALAPLPPNLRLWTADARRLIAALPDGALGRLYLMFPDPWPKARHARRRFVHPATLGEVARVLSPGAEWRLASDDPTYQNWVAETLGAQALFEIASVADARPDGWPPTRYEAKALREGRRPRYWTLVRRGVAT